MISLGTRKVVPRKLAWKIFFCTKEERFSYAIASTS